MAIELQKFFHAIKCVPRQWKIIFDSTFSIVLSCLSYKSFTQTSCAERTFVLSHCKETEEKLIARNFQSQKTLYKLCNINLGA